MANEASVARNLKARYAFAGPGVEVDKTLPLQSGEVPILQGRVRVAFRIPVFWRLGYIRLTPGRFCILLAHAFVADRIIEVPKAAFVGLEIERVQSLLGPLMPRSQLRLTFLAGDGEQSIVLSGLAELRPGNDVRGGFKATFADHSGVVRRDPMLTLASVLEAWRDHALR